MNKTWRIKSKGRLVFLLIYYVLLFLIVNFVRKFILGMFALAVFLPIVFAIVAATTYWILRKKIPGEVTIDAEKGEIVLQLNKTNSIAVPLSSAAYSLHTYEFYSVLLIYKETPASRPGYWLHKEVIDIVATKPSLSWDSAKLTEIAKELNSLGVKKLDKKDSKGFFMRIMG